MVVVHDHFEKDVLVEISFDLDIKAMMRELPEWSSKRVPSITRNALNDTVVAAREAEQNKIKGTFDRPTPWIERSPRYKKATKDDLVAEVFITPDVNGGGVSPVNVLKAEVAGGQRKHKRFEVSLIKSGLMRPDEYAIPAMGQQRDAYGNLPGTLVVRILSQLRAFNEVGFLANRTKRSAGRNVRRVRVRYFVPMGARAEKGINRLPRGIYERRGGDIRAVVIFVKPPRYQRRYDFGQATIAKAERVFPGLWQKYFNAELAKRSA